MTASDFQRFSEAALLFLSDLKANNTRDWFAANKTVYETEIKAPAAAFCDVMTAELQRLTGQVHSAKVFRIYRDVRFSKDKTPYNTHLHIAFTPQSELASPPMWFFGLGLEKLSLGCGVFSFDPATLEQFRARVTGPDGDKIAGVLADLWDAGMRLHEPELKRVPNGYPKDHPHADLLRHKGLSAWTDLDDRSIITRPDGVRRCMAEFERLKPLFDMLNRPAR